MSEPATTALRVRYAEQRAALRALQASIAATGVDSHVPPALAARLAELTAAAEQTKAELRAAGVELPGDEAGEHGLGGVVDQRRGNFISGGTFHGEVIGVQTVVVSNRSQRDRDNRRRMLRQVQRFWIAGVLDQSLFQEVLLALALHTDPQAVGFRGPQLAVRLDQTPRPLPPDTPIAQVYRQANQRLLILGAPGAGKTTLLLELTRSLLAEAEHDETRPLPVIFNLSSWAQQRLPLEQWMLLELRDQYGVGRRIAWQWLAENSILPLLDGLDEVAEPQRAACIAAVNRFLAEHGGEGIVVCSRSADYAAADSRLLLDQAVQIQPLDDAQIDGYFVQAGPPLTGVRDALAQDAELRGLARTPLLLNILALAYQGRHPDELVGLRAAALRRRLLDSYVQRMFDRPARSDPRRYTRVQTLRWLRWLAKRLAEEKQTVFQVEAIQPWWLRGRGQGGLYVLLSTAVVVAGGALLGTLAGLLFGLICGLCIEALIWRFPEAMDLIFQISGQSRTDLGLGAALDTGLSGGWFFGLAIGLGGGAGIGLFQRPREQRRGWHVAAGIVLALLLGSLVSLLALKGWIPFVICWGFWGITLGVATGVLIRRGAIQPTEALRWNRGDMRRRWRYGAGFGLLIGLPLGIVFALLGWLSLGPAFGLGLGLGAALTVGLFFGLVGCLIGGIGQVEVQTKTLPNQGIWRSLRHAVAAWLVAGAAVATVVGLGMAVVFGLITGIILGPVLGIVSGLITAFGLGLVIALASGPPAGLYFGGLAVAQHLTLRLICALWGDMPWNYPRFLDYAVERILLRRVGGSYIFVHRLVLEHFAEDELGADADALPNDQDTEDSSKTRAGAETKGATDKQP